MMTINDPRSIFEVLNWFANIVLLLFCIWAALDKRVSTHLPGTIAAAFGALFAGINIVKPGALGIFSEQSQTIVNAFLAGLAVWYYFHWRKKNLSGRRVGDK